MQNLELIRVHGYKSYRALQSYTLSSSFKDSLAIWSLHKAHLIMPYLHCALTRAPPSVHHSLAGIGLLMLTTYDKPQYSPRLSSVASPPRFLLHLPPQAESALQLPDFLLCSTFPSSRSMRREVTTLQIIPLYPRIFPYVLVLVLTTHYLLPILKRSSSFLSSLSAPPPTVRVSFKEQDLGCSSSLFFSLKQVSLNSSLIY